MLRYVLLTAFLVRCLACLVWQWENDAQRSLFRFGDSETYWVLASKIARSQPYDYAGPDSRVFRAPLYPIVIAPATLLPGRTGVLTARFIGVALGTLSVLLVWYAARELRGNRAAHCAALLAALYPGAIGMSIFVLSEALFCPLIVGSLWLGARLCSQSSLTSDWRQQFTLAATAGGLSGLASLTRPSFFLWPVIAMIAFMLSARAVCITANDRRLWSRGTAKGLKLSLGFGLGVVVTMSPWWWRNYLVTGHFVPTTLQVGASLLDGLHAGASGGSDEGMAFVLPHEQVLRNERKNRVELKSIDLDNDSQQNLKSENFEWELNQRLLVAATSWARQNRSDVCWLALVKFEKMWTPWPTAKEVGGWGVRVAESIGYLVILFLTNIALCVVRERRWETWLYVLPLFYFALLHLVFASSVRYRQPAILVLCIVAGTGAAWMLERISKRNANASTRKL